MSASDDDRRLIAPLRYWAAAAEDHPFLTFTDLEDRTEQLSYGEFYDQVRRLARGLAASGVTPGDRCIVHTGNSLGFMLAFWGLQEAGAVAVPTIAQYAADELRYVVEHCQARAVIAAPQLLPTARTATDGLDAQLVVDDLWDSGAGDGELRLSGLIAGGNGSAAAADTDPGDTALILYTSGTTSRPKGVMLGNAGTIYTATSFAQHLRLHARDTILTCMPLFHVNGMFLQMVPAVLSGAKLVVTPRFSASQYWRWVREHEATVTHLIAGPVRLLLAADQRSGDRDHHVRSMTFGLPLTAAEIAAFEARFEIPLAMVWGLTETCCGGTLMPIDFGRRPGQQHIGPPLLGWDVRVASQDGLEALPDGQVGELLVRSPGVMQGYYREPETTGRVLDHGWVRSGDLGFRDQHGQLHFVDRIKDMLKPSGENVAASEIEDLILSHPDIAECAVVGLPDPVRSETVVALVVPNPGSEISAEDVQAFCLGRLARFKVPTIVEVRDTLPKTSIGKIRKGELRLELQSTLPQPPLGTTPDIDS